ncbi:MAG: L-seryl-tRNA(Sec) selenium transferase [candidate division KSB1 bacterium]|nr:L-seryl-tRNA(Sec) selenium transferase [candidate division KSB1 bacterium]MDZ7335513.1 L-seryl-tRNA(Sec) selenium transferase [candidate division KSB1 bacterium]MDZ7357106.1 L-seryl-tRNA(Sec) selenium transferase [candidate division KSB1 bacterium]MDZ7401770.1 L-seryl-tRNA(Sec) selenium transferase [candidate division KSB1 bacterium]
MKQTGEPKRSRILSQLPQVDKLLQSNEIAALLDQYPRELILDQIRKYLDQLRWEIQQIPDQKLSEYRLNRDELIERLRQELQLGLRPKLRRVINGTGIVLHTGLGRAPLPKPAQQALIEVSEGFSSVEIDLDSGKRGNRHSIVEDLLIKLTGAEAAAVVNNNAAATLLALNTLAFGKGTIVSRGELITIGGSYRIPEIMKKSGTQMIEVGTTNHTDLWEYEQAINDQTGLLLKVHTSNYRIIGFVSDVSLAELVQLGHRHQLPVMHDLGSGMLFDLSRYGLPKEPVVSESIRLGADVVTFSGDKLLGGPQAGILVGKRKYIDAIKKNQLSRALRCGKLTFAALEATLRLFLDKEKLLEHHPVLKFMLRTEAELEQQAIQLKDRLQQIIGGQGEVTVAAGLSEVGGGSLATESLPTRLLLLQLGQYSPEALARKLRLSDPPIIPRIVNNRVALDQRTIRPDEIEFIILAVSNIVSSGGAQ